MRLQGNAPQGVPALSYIGTPSGSMVGSASRPVGNLIAVPGVSPTSLNPFISIIPSTLVLAGDHAGCVLSIPNSGIVTLYGGDFPISASATLFAAGPDGMTVDDTSVTVLGGDAFLNVAQGGMAWVYRATSTDWIVAGGTS